MSLPGDEELVHADRVTNHAVTIDAPPEAVWPWLVQMGYQRGGLYSFDRLDRLVGYLDRPSADEILPAFQHLEAGDVIPIGKGTSWPVAAVEPNRALVLAIPTPDFTVTWSFVLTPLGGGTRLISRVRVAFASSPFRARLICLAIDPFECAMTMAMLRGIKQRAERLQHTHVAATDRAEDEVAAPHVVEPVPVESRAGV